MAEMAQDQEGIDMMKDIAPKRDRNDHTSDRRCSICRSFKTINQFMYRPSTGIYDSWCRPCRNEYNRNQRKKPEEKRKDKNRFFIKKYGLTIEDYDRLLLEQNNLCKICLKPERFKTKDGSLKALSVDHCHFSGRVRGLLCNDCNTTLGRFKDSAQILNNAIEYLTIFNFMPECRSSRKRLPRREREDALKYLSFLNQNRCSICEEKESRLDGKGNITSLCVDHNHKTGLIRGALCHNCNAAIGLIKEDIEILSDMINYLYQDNRNVNIVVQTTGNDVTQQVVDVINDALGTNRNGSGSRRY